MSDGERFTTISCVIPTGVSCNSQFERVEFSICPIDLYNFSWCVCVCVLFIKFQTIKVLIQLIFRKICNVLAIHRHFIRN